MNTQDDGFSERMLQYGFDEWVKRPQNRGKTIKDYKLEKQAGEALQKKLDEERALARAENAGIGCAVAAMPWIIWLVLPGLAAWVVGLLLPSTDFLLRMVVMLALMVLFRAFTRARR